MIFYNVTIKKVI